MNSEHSENSVQTNIKNQNVKQKCNGPETILNSAEIY